MEKNGILYIAFKKHHLVDHIKEVIHSAKSVKRLYPSLHITLFTDKDPNSEYFDKVETFPINSKRVKQHFLYRTPYKNTLYLDSDTEIVGPIIELFDLMERFDIAATHDLMRKDKKKSGVYSDYADIPDGFPEFAGGVILFKKTDVIRNFFKVWRKNYNKWYSFTKEERDQPSFRVSLWECFDLHIHTLPPEFNIRTKKYDNIVPRINHWHNMWRK